MSSAPEEDLKRLAQVVGAKLAELVPKGRPVPPQAMLLAAMALAHEVETARGRARRRSNERTRDLLRRTLVRIDDALEPFEDAESARERVERFHVKQGTPAGSPVPRRSHRRGGPREPAPNPPRPRDGARAHVLLERLSRLSPSALPPARPSGAGASRLVSGERAEHVELEQAAADLVGLPAALAFTSGYAANLGLLSALAGPEDLDRQRRAQPRLDRRRRAPLPSAVSRSSPTSTSGAVGRGPGIGRAGRRAFVVTESYFSMDADSPDLAERAAGSATPQAPRSSSTSRTRSGVLGPDGRGLCAAAGDRARRARGDVREGVRGRRGLRCRMPRRSSRWLWNRARIFVFSTGLSPAVAAAAAAGIRDRARRAGAAGAHARGRPPAPRRSAGDGRARRSGYGHIVPVGRRRARRRPSEPLGRSRAEGIDVRAIRPPSVPAGTARLRFAVTCRPPERRHRAGGRRRPRRSSAGRPR